MSTKLKLNQALAEEALRPLADEMLTTITEHSDHLVTLADRLENLEVTVYADAQPDSRLRNRALISQLRQDAKSNHDTLFPAVRPCRICNSNEHIKVYNDPLRLICTNNLCRQAVRISLLSLPSTIDQLITTWNRANAEYYEPHSDTTLSDPKVSSTS